MARINKQGYIERRTTGSRGTKSNPTYREWWLVKARESIDNGVPRISSLQISIKHLSLPSEYLGKKVLTCGVFDILHIGHINFLEECAKHGKLVVGVGTDEYVKRYKKKKSVEPFEVRMKKVGLLPFVHKVVPHDETNSITVYDQENIKTMFICEDYNFTKSHFERLKEAAMRNIHVGVIKRTPGISTTILKKQLQSEAKKVTKKKSKSSSYPKVRKRTSVSKKKKKKKSIFDW